MPNFELELLKRITPLFKTNSSLIVPIGDDCAAVQIPNSDKLLLFASDQLIGNIHYFENSTPPEVAGAKLLKRNLSDIAAMGGKPLYALVNLANHNFDIDYLAKFMLGINEVANAYNLLIIGGDIAHFNNSSTSNDSSNLISSLTIIGEVEKLKICERKNAQAGDLIFVTGTLGESLTNEHHLNFTPRLVEGQFLADNNLTNCMMDISDGLLLDLGRICQKSNISAKIQLKNLPLRNKALNYKQIFDGEDYELLFAVKPENEERLKMLWNNDLTPITQIGEFIQSGKIEILDDNNQAINIGNLGYEH